MDSNKLQLFFLLVCLNGLFFSVSGTSETGKDLGYKSSVYQNDVENEYRRICYFFDFKGFIFI